MSVTRDIVASYRDPRGVIRRRTAGPPREDRALVTVMLACGLIFVAQWPRLVREATLSGEVPLEALLGGALLGWLFVAPLVLYALAGLAHLLARLMGGRGRGFDARMALFWALLAATPLWLLQGLTAGFVGPGAALAVVGAVALTVFLVFWGVMMHEVERTAGAAP